METRLRLQGRHDLDRILAEKVNQVKDVFVTETAKFDG
jgi:hypothetical protein